MLKYEYRKAPVYYIDGVPGYKAGEWPGIKSCKFENTRQIICQKSHGIFFTGIYINIYIINIIK